MNESLESKVGVRMMDWPVARNYISEGSVPHINWVLAQNQSSSDS